MIPKKEFNKTNLLAQGVPLFMQQGYHGTGLKEILDAVQIPKGSFYNYFPSKESYVAEVIQHYIAPFIELLDSHLQNPKLDAINALKAYFDELTVKLENADFRGGCLLGNLMGEVGDTSELCQQSLQLAVNNYCDRIAQGLKKAQDEGTVRSDKSADEMARLLFDAWQGAMLRMKVEQSSAPLKNCCRDLLEDYFSV